MSAKVLYSAGKEGGFSCHDSDIPVNLHKAGQDLILAREGSEHTKLLMRLIFPVPGVGISLRVSFEFSLISLFYFNTHFWLLVLH